ncbi:MAG: FprA family A-type flavoprotein [Thermoplasmata archaeon]
MAVMRLKKDIYEVGAVDWDRELFDELIPLPDGTSYNAYLIRGSEKVALLDTVDPPKESVLMDNLNSLGVDHIDYVISHHCEQDHSGSIPAVLERYPMARVVTNQKCMKMLKDHLHVPNERFLEVKDGEELSLGDRTLRFIYAPWVHWPETMLTHLPEDGILFTCDLFGSHMAASNLFVRDKNIVYPAAKRYYAEIMMPFRRLIKGHIKKLEKLDFDVIAPSHGPIYDEPDFIMDAYRDWISDEVRNEVVVPYVSMHGSTEDMVQHLVNTLIEKGIKVTPYNLTTTDLGDLAMSLVDAATVVIATPTVLTGPHPKALYAAYLVNALRPKTKFVSLIGSYGWGGRMPDVIKDSIKNLKAEMIEPVVVKGHPTAKDLEDIERLAEDIMDRHEKNI